MQYDSIIIGGSYAGLSAALSLGRAMRTVLVIDSGEPCNRFSPVSHNFLTRDGIAPSELTRIAREQVSAYPTVDIMNDTVTGIEKDGALFLTECLSGKKFTASKLLFATGIKDILPDIPGMDECWGISVMHCPYCDGFEVRGQRLAILGNGDEGFELAMFLKHWSKDLVLLTNGKSTLSSSQLEFLTSLHIPVIEDKVVSLIHNHGRLESVQLESGKTCEADAMYIKQGCEQQCQLPAKLGCNSTTHDRIEIDDHYATNIKGIYAAGDCANTFRSVAQAVAAGNRAGVMIDKALTADKLSEAKHGAKSLG